MSRSKRKNPMIGITTARSDKPFKTDEHRRERRKARAVVRETWNEDDNRLHAEVYGDPWKAPKDGKSMVDPKSKWMRK